ncbi:hypothetical protein [Streptomyces mayteni]
MSAVVTELGQRVLDRWAALLALPGLLFVAAVWAARELGHRGFADPGRLRAAVSSLADSVAEDPVRLAFWVALLPLLSAAAGLAAGVCAGALRRLWFGPWPARPSGPGRRLTAGRARRWRLRAAAYRAAEEAEAGQRELDVLAARRNAVGLRPPERPTWMADRMTALAARVWAWYRVDVSFAWPRLWLLLTPEEQDALRAARGRVDAAVVLAGWGVLVCGLAVWWWPGTVVGAAMLGEAVRRGRAAVDAFAHLVEAAFDLRVAALAESLRLELPEGPFPPEVGLRVTALLRKQA